MWRGNFIMTENQIIILCFVGFWMLVSMLTYILLLRYIKKEYRKFYPHPIVNIVKDINSNNRFKFWEKLFIFTCLNIVYLPIICEWLIAWCLYKFWNYIYVDNAQEAPAVEEILQPQEENIKALNENKVSESLKDYDESINNPEYISKEEKEEQASMSSKYMDFLYDNQKA